MVSPELEDPAREASIINLYYSIKKTIKMLIDQTR